MNILNIVQAREGAEKGPHIPEQYSITNIMNAGEMSDLSRLPAAKYRNMFGSDNDSNIGNFCFNNGSTSAFHSLFSWMAISFTATKSGSAIFAKYTTPNPPEPIIFSIAKLCLLPSLSKKNFNVRSTVGICASDTTGTIAVQVYQTATLCCVL